MKRGGAVLSLEDVFAAASNDDALVPSVAEINGKNVSSTYVVVRRRTSTYVVVHRRTSTYVVVVVIVSTSFVRSSGPKFFFAGRSGGAAAPPA